MAAIGVVVLPGEHDDLDRRGRGQQFRDQPEPLVGAVRQWWQAQIHECQPGNPAELGEQTARLGA